MTTEHLADPVPDALAGYVAQMRRQRRWYFAVLTVIVVAVAATVSYVMSHSEIAHAHLHSASVVPPALDPAPLSATPVLAWRTSDAVAIGQPLWSGTVVTYSAHTVTGRDARTGAADWTFTRTDATVCQVAQEQGSTVAFFDHNGNCDEVSAFATGTGTRSWDRTLDANAEPINGRPQFVASQFTILVVTAAQVEAIDPSGSNPQGGLDRWDYAAPSGCSNNAATLGTTGVLIGQHCADGSHLLLRDSYAADTDTGAVKWRISSGAAPVAADALVAGLNRGSGVLVVYNPANGAVTHRVPLAPAAATAGPIVEVSTTTLDLIWVDGTCYAVSVRTAARGWAIPLAGPPALAASVLLGTNGSGVALLDGVAGRIATTYPVPGLPAGSTVYPAGSGFVVSGSAPTPTAVYR
ncbi:MAG TPA: hypothetical protein VK816_11715 [Jatrophihabitantaceae bacterium]|nr:hypothetical protein [Jatrophihabitantaceae bacterium]